jgi:uroporphyrinogen decarboxylase
MTSRERFLAAARMQKPDRVPVAPYMGNFGAVQAGVPVGQYNTDPVKMADAQTRAWEKLGQDVLVAQSDQYYLAQGFGCVIEQPEDATPHLVRTPYASLEEAAAARLKVIDPWRDGRMHVYLEAVRLLRARFGPELAVRGPGTGPFSLASYLYGTQDFLMDIATAEGDGDADRRRRLLDLMEFSSDCLIAFLKALLEAGSDIAQAGDSLASLDMISPAIYETYVWPYEKKVFDAVGPPAHARGAVTLLHICGDTSLILPRMAATGADILELDHKVDLARARQLAGGRVALMGNLDPTGLLLQGTPEQVGAASRAAITAARGTAGGFILGSGCEVPPRAPLANMQAMVAAARIC